MSTMHVTEEDWRRADQRRPVIWARRHHHWRWLWWLLLGPGILVMLGENDAPSMLSYAATGAQFGVGIMVPFVLVTFAMAYVVQEMTVRLGTATQSGHAELIYHRFGPFWGTWAMIDLAVTNFLTLITEFVGIVAGASYFGVPALAAVGGALAIIVASVALRRYWVWERAVLALAVFNLVFVAIAVSSPSAWQELTQHAWTAGWAGGWSAPHVLIFVSDMGATITPWMLFFQQGAVADKGLMPADLSIGRADTALGALLASLSAVACIGVTAVLHGHLTAAQFGAAQFAQALKTRIGSVGASLFALGISEAGLVAAINIAVSTAYTFGEVRRIPHSLNRSYGQAPGFYNVLAGGAVLAAACVLVPHFPLEAVALLVNVIAVLTMPPAIAFLLLLSADEAVVGRRSARASRGALILAWMVGAVVMAAGLWYAASVVWP